MDSDLVTYVHGECCAGAVMEYRKSMHAREMKCLWEMNFIEYQERETTEPICGHFLRAT